MTGWLIALAIVLFLWFFPLGVDVRYNSEGPKASLIIGPFRFLVFPKQKKQKSKKKKDIKDTDHSRKKTEKNADEKKGGSVTDFFPIVRLVLDFLDGFRRKLRINRMEMKLILAGGDPCDLAINYGRAWAGVGTLFTQLERAFVIKKRDVEVECDFVSDATKIYARLDLTITLGRILSLGVWHGIRILKKFIYILNQRKGGTENESKSS